MSKTIGPVVNLLDTPVFKAAIAQASGDQRGDPRPVDPGTEFTWLRNKTSSTDENLGAHLTKLDEVRYVSVVKKFVQRKPQTLYRMTAASRTALTEYVQALRQLLGDAIRID